MALQFQLDMTAGFDCTCSKGHLHDIHFSGCLDHLFRKMGDLDSPSGGRTGEDEGASSSPTLPLM